jgi:hypothetical protein
MKITNKKLYDMICNLRENDTLNVVHRNKNGRSVYFVLDVDEFIRFHSTACELIYPYEVVEDCGDLYIHLYHEW